MSSGLSAADAGELGMSGRVVDGSKTTVFMNSRRDAGTVSNSTENASSCAIGAATALGRTWNDPWVLARSE
jgi:hypothetical protein